MATYKNVDEAFNFNTTERRITHMSQIIYLDNAATTRTRREVAEAMLPYFTENYGNPSSVYEFSTPCKQAIAHTREIIKLYLTEIQITAQQKHMRLKENTLSPAR